MGVTGDRVETASSPFLWLWIVFAAITTLFYVALLLVYYFQLKRGAPQPTTRIDGTMERQTSLPAGPYSAPQALPKQPCSRALSQSASIFTDTDWSVDIEEAAPDVSSTGTKLDSALIETRQSRCSLASESFRTASASRASLDTVKLPPPIGPACLSTTRSLRPSRRSQLLGPGYAHPLPSPSSDDSFVEQEGVGKDPSNQRSPRAEHVAHPPCSNNNRTDNVPRALAPPYKPATQTLLSLDRTHPPSSFTFPVGPQSISRSPIATSSSTATPAYSASPYRERRDTLASNQTYETLPSYHSRRSTQALADMTISSTPHNMRSLPSLPALPLFAPGSLVTPMNSFNSCSTRDSLVRPLATPERKHSTSRESKEPEQ
ncbi:hypothetical protein PM082_009310 [Marasmius tenuissimus]|nr:hypothetical protein PM082_009310 [Marasmius tenuissimus]